jgi:hypothetical protein
LNNLSDSDSESLEQEEKARETKIENMLSLGDIGFQVMPNHFLEVIDFKELKKEPETRALFLLRLSDSTSLKVEKGCYDLVKVIMLVRT